MLKATAAAFYKLFDNMMSCISEKTELSYQRLNEKEKSVWPQGATDFHQKSCFFKSRLLEMNRGQHCHTEFTVYAPQQVLDLPECLCSLNNKFVFIYSCAIGKCKCYPGVGMDFSLSFTALVIHLFVQLIQGATANYIKKSMLEGCFALALFDLDIL